jgi:hypothetical protein
VQLIHLIVYVSHCDRIFIPFCNRFTRLGCWREY